MKTSELNYDLPDELIAQSPGPRREESRLLVLHRRDGRMEHRRFTDLLDYLAPEDCLVLNRTRVVPARFSARRQSGGRVSALFVSEDSPGAWRVLLTGVGRLRAGESLTVEGGHWKMTFKERLERGLCRVQISPPDRAFDVLDRIGLPPLPPYIRRGAQSRGDATTSLDRERYQTVYAREAGSVAAPTAGLHFTTEMLSAIRDRGIGVAEVLLHVGLGTFQPIEVEDLAAHVMHREWYELDESAAATVASARLRGGRIIAVGTTSVRVLETCVRAQRDGTEITTDAPRRLPAPGSGWTDIFIYPPHEFSCVDALVTNFHLPGSSLLALVMAMAGCDATRRAYRDAIERRYRFFSYGDAMLIL